MALWVEFSVPKLCLRRWHWQDVSTTANFTEAAVFLEAPRTILKELGCLYAWYLGLQRTQDLHSNAQTGR